MPSTQMEFDEDTEEEEEEKIQGSPSKENNGKKKKRKEFRRNRWNKLVGYGTIGSHLFGADIRSSIISYFLLSST
ncbi:unnamed protein product [Rhizophagus irregularis]|nr:unnamed protein product [Rhizophagus irregularis]